MKISFTFLFLMCNCHITYELVTDCLWKYVGIVHESRFEAGTFYGQEQPGFIERDNK